MKRLRLFAGPNGSGKSTLKDILSEKLLGIYINPDEIEKELKTGLDFKKFKLNVSKSQIIEFFDKNKEFYQIDLKTTKIQDNFFQIDNPNSYIASILSSFIRYNLLNTSNSFTFESVMSSIDKVGFLKKAKQKGFRVYLYFIATYDPIINIQRVKNRVKLGGHNVPEDKIISRYYRSIQNLSKAIKYTDRCYIFDNSNAKRSWLCEITEAKKVEIKVDEVPEWFMNVLNNLKEKK